MSAPLPPADLGLLDEYSRFAVDRILERFPEWRAHMVFQCPENYERPFAEFTVASPSAAIEHGLWVSTADNEMTVGLHTHHSHFTNHDDCKDPEHISDALDHVQALLNERIVILSWYIGDRFVGSTSRDVATNMSTESSILSRVTRTTLRSWRGTYDCDTESKKKSWLKSLFSK